jgi:hypothetical protein
MTPEILAVWWSLTTPNPWDGKWLERPAIVRSHVLPPAEYDHPFRGKLYISAENLPETIITAYGFPASDVGKRIVFGCARPPYWYVAGIGMMKANECTILLAKRELIEQYQSYDDTIRHEITHCSGWRH